MKKFGKDQDLFVEQLNKHNARRLQLISVAFIFVVSLQFFAYVLDKDISYASHLVWVKFAIMVAGFLTVWTLQLLYSGNETALAHSTLIIGFSSFAMILFAVLNTWYAQGISNDISIYMMVLMAVIASSRMQVIITLSVLLSTYTIFAIGMFYFQPNSTYLFSHLINGAMSNIIGFLIANMFYAYSERDFEDKRAIDMKNMRLKELSERDDLTGLYNKRTINMHLMDLIDQSKETGKTLYLGILDLDHFKTINDSFGHVFGDEVLRKIGDVITEKTDEDVMVGRYGGDEFVVIFHDTPLEEVREAMIRLLDEVNQLKFYDLRLSFSCGIATWNGESSDKLFERADAYMYDVKRTGKNNIKLENVEVV
jgi:diguanylate cyclase (GGDEF)-like protein